jgi:hypothetical protein
MTMNRPTTNKSGGPILPVRLCSARSLRQDRAARQDPGILCHEKPGGQAMSVRNNHRSALHGSHSRRGGAPMLFWCIKHWHC